MYADHTASTLEDLSLEVLDSLQSAADEVQRRETWLPPGRGVLMHVIPRLIRLAHAAGANLPEKVFVRRTIRQNTLRALAYAPPDTRLATLFDLALTAKPTLSDLLIGPIDPEYEPYRYNIVTTIGIFARHGLIRAISDPVRVRKVEAAFVEARKILTDQTDKGDAS